MTPLLSQFIDLCRWAGALLVLLPVYLGLSGFEPGKTSAYLFSAYTVGIAFLPTDEAEREMAMISIEKIALEDEYFVDRKLYPNVDFYSGILYRAMGIPVNMFTVMFAIGRLPGWLAHWKELREDDTSRIYRPRQIYTGPTERSYIPVTDR